MIELQKALSAIQGIKFTGNIKKVPLNESLNHVAASDVLADSDIPPFNKAAMDGYACRTEDMDHELKIIGEIPAGNWPAITIKNGECARIMTGAPLPAGADCVVMKEHVTINPGNSVTINRKSTGSNICYEGEDMNAGKVVVNKGDRITPARISMLATVGCIFPVVYCLPEVAVLSTGSELVNSSERPQPGKIRNSNGHQIVAQLKQMGITAVDLGISLDNRDDLKKILSEAIENYDLTIISGGVSVGEYDYIPGIIEELSDQTIFHGLKIKPGKHALLAQRNNHFIAALPGNPVSAFVLFEILIKPLLSHLMGEQTFTSRVLTTLSRDYNSKVSDLFVFVPVRLTSEGDAEPVDYHGSAHIMAFTRADGILEIPPGTGKIQKGEKVHVRLL